MQFFNCHNYRGVTEGMVLCGWLKVGGLCVRDGGEVGCECKVGMQWTGMVKLTQSQFDVVEDIKILSSGVSKT